MGGARLETASGSALREKVCLDKLYGNKSFTYRPIPGYEGSGDWVLVKSRYRSEDLELTPWDEV